MEDFDWEKMNFMNPTLNIFLLLALAINIVACKDQPADNNNMTTTNDSHLTTSVSQEFFRNNSFSVVRIEKHRVFVVVDSSSINDMKAIRSIIKEVEKHYQFDKLAISFFTDSIYAGYKTEFIDNSTEAHKWANSYVGEYSVLSKEYWTYPLKPDVKLKYIIEQE